MPGISPQSITRFCNQVTFVVSVIGLLVLIIAPLQCGQVPAWSGGRNACSPGTGWYFFVVVFVIFTGVSGYRVYRMRREGTGKF